MPKHKQTHQFVRLYLKHAWHKRTVMYEGRWSQSWNGAAVFIKVVRDRMEVLCSIPVLPLRHSKPYSTSIHGPDSPHLVCRTPAALQARNKTPLHKKERRKEEAASLPTNTSVTNSIHGYLIKNLSKKILGGCCWNFWVTHTYFSGVQHQCVEWPSIYSLV